MKNVFCILVVASLLFSCSKKGESNKKNKMIILGGILLSQKSTPAYLCNRKVTCRRYSSKYTTQNGKYSYICSFDSVNLQLNCSISVTENSSGGQWNLIYYYKSKSDFIDESACIGLNKISRIKYDSISLNGNVIGLVDQVNTFNDLGYPLKFLDVGVGTTTATSWDSLGRPVIADNVTNASGCNQYIKYIYDDSNLIIRADFVRSSNCSSTSSIYSPNERRFNQDYNEIQRNTFIQDSTGKITITENITINSTEEICK